MQALWISNGGRISCSEHGGRYLREAVNAKPDRFNVYTPLDHWQRLPINAHDDYGCSCETCDKEHGAS